MNMKLSSNKEAVVYVVVGSLILASGIFLIWLQIRRNKMPAPESFLHPLQELRREEAIHNNPFVYRDVYDHVWYDDQIVAQDVYSNAWAGDHLFSNDAYQNTWINGGTLHPDISENQWMDNGLLYNDVYLNTWKQSRL